MVGKNCAFVDASNLFYGGEKSLGWKIDYQKLLAYLKEKYQIDSAFYFGGVEIHGFEFDYLINETVPIKQLEEYLIKFISDKKDRLDEARLVLLSRQNCGRWEGFEFDRLRGYYRRQFVFYPREVFHRTMQEVAG